MVALFLSIPLLLIALLLYYRRSLRRHLLLVGSLGYFLYTYASTAFLTAYNPLFLSYVTLFSARLFAFALAFMSIDMQALSAHLPCRIIARFLFVTGAFLLLIWLGVIVPPLLAGQAPQQLERATTNH